MTRPIASLSMDLDNHWSYLRVQGDPRWEALPSYMEILIPRVVDFFERRALRITFFIVGQDTELPGHASLFRGLADAGHEVGNHSFAHEPWLHLYADDELEAEITHAHDAIAAATGRQPIGFRGPGYSLSGETLRVLARHGYRYDASTLPTFLGPIARAYYFRAAGLSREERRRRTALFGSFRDGFRPIRPFCWDIDGARMIEIPVTTMPIVRTPIHLSYILALSGASRAAGLAYFRTALSLCEASGVEPSILLHPLDFLDGGDVSGLGFFPGMGLTLPHKQAVVTECMDALRGRFDVLTLSTHATRLASRARLPVRSWRDGKGRLLGSRIETLWQQ